jgi:hypothetical protein
MTLEEKTARWKEYPNALGSEAQAAVIVGEVAHALGQAVPETISVALKKLALRGTMRDIAQAIQCGNELRAGIPSFHEVVDVGAAAAGLSWTEAITAITGYLDAASAKLSARSAMGTWESKEHGMTNDEGPAYERDPLGGDEFVQDIDLPPENCEISSDEWDRKIDDWASSGGTVESPLNDSWNTLPFGDPGGCRPKLFVDVRSSNMIGNMFALTSQHLVKCPRTKFVVFHVGGDFGIGYLEWMNELIRQLSMEPFASAQAKFVTRVSRSWTPRANQNPQMWCGATIDTGPHADPNVVAVFEDRRHPQKRAMLKHRVWLLEELGLLSNDFGYIKLHNNQPTNPTTGSDISFGERQGNRIMNWKSRIYLNDEAADYPLGFHPQRTPYLDQRVVCGAHPNWISADRIGFLVEPYRWLNRLDFPDRRPP